MNPADAAQSDPPTPDEPPSTAGHAPPAPPDAQPGDNQLVIDLSLHTDDADPPLLGWLDHMLARAAALAGVTRGRLGLIVVADDEMARLHEQWKRVPGTTDVLTFDLAEDDAPENQPDGDIVVCLDEARRQADHHGHTPRQELLLYAVHGLLHLLGEDDHDDDAYAQMHRREDELLTALGVGPVFSPGPRPTPDRNPTSQS